MELSDCRVAVLPVHIKQKNRAVRLWLNGLHHACHVGHASREQIANLDFHFFSLFVVVKTYQIFEGLSSLYPHRYQIVIIG